jgi:hypothetical protein
MKNLLILLTLFSFNSHACMNWISQSELTKALNLEAGTKAGCKKDEECFCYDKIDWHAASLEDELTPEERWSGKFNRELCRTVEACEAIRETHCTDGKEFFYAKAPDESGQDSLEAYCAFKLAPAMVKTGRKVLQENPAKVAARQARLNQERNIKSLEKIHEEKIALKMREMAIKEIEKEGKK